MAQEIININNMSHAQLTEYAKQLENEVAIRTAQLQKNNPSHKLFTKKDGLTFLQRVYNNAVAAYKNKNQIKMAA